MEERIKFIMKSKGLTQVQFARQIGSTQNTVSSYVTGIRKPSSSVINNICKTFSVNEEWLRTGNGEPFIDIEEDAELAEWVGRVMNDADMAAQKRALRILKNIKNSDLEVIERLVLMAAEMIESHKDE